MLSARRLLIQYNIYFLQHSALRKSLLKKQSIFHRSFYLTYKISPLSIALHLHQPQQASSPQLYFLLRSLHQQLQLITFDQAKTELYYKSKRVDINLNLYSYDKYRRR